METGDNVMETGWGWLSGVESYGKPGDKATDFQEVEYTTSQTDETLKKYMHAAHGMIFAKDGGKTFDLYPRKALILMQMRFDGCIGFPGGLVDEAGEEPVDSLNRELVEEIGLDQEKYVFTQADHVVSHKNTAKTLVTHFYAKELTIDEVQTIEKNILNAFEYGRETLGPVRVPLFTMGDGFRGLPVFLCNQFAGNARQQLLRAISHFSIMTDGELKSALSAFQKFSSRDKN